MKFLSVLFVALALSACHSSSVDPGTEGVVVKNPWFFGHGGAQADTQKPGLSWYAWSTSVYPISVAPSKYDEPLEHIATADNNFINYGSYIVLQWKDLAYNFQKFGMKKWYDNNLKEQYRTIVRDVTKQYAMTKIMTDQDTLQKIEDEIGRRFRGSIEASGLHVDLINVNMGKALPNAVVVREMDNTAAQQQRIKTEGQRKLAEDARRQAEQSRAEADNAYREQMKLDANQFVQLESIKRYSEACHETKSCVIVNGNAPVLIGK